MNYEAELNIRAGKLPMHPPPPEHRGSGRHSAYGSGFEAGFRNWAHNENSYIRRDCKEAYDDGYDAGAQLSAELIRKETDALEKRDLKRQLGGAKLAGDMVRKLRGGAYGDD